MDSVLVCNPEPPVSKHITQIAVRVAGQPTGQGAGVENRNLLLYPLPRGALPFESEFFKAEAVPMPPFLCCPIFMDAAIVILFLEIIPNDKCSENIRDSEATSTDFA